MAYLDDHGGRAGHSWWADALDPVENLQALADAQRFGRRAAENLADHLLSGGANGNGPNGNGRSADDPDRLDADLSETIRRLRADALRAGELSISIVDHLATLLAAVARGLPRNPQPDREPDTVLLPTVAAGAQTSGLFWIHNTSAVAVASVRPHALPLRSHLGAELPGTAVQFDPVMLDPLPPRSSCGIDVRVSVPATAQPATYVSIILVTNVPEMHLPLRVTVRPDEDPHE